MAGFLPYGGGGTGLWSGSFMFSVSAHAAMTAGLYALYTAAPLPPPLEERTAFTVTLEQLDTGVLDGTVQDEYVPPDAEGTGAGGDGEEELAALDETETLEPSEPEIEEAEAVEPDEPEIQEPEIEEVEQAEIEEVEAPELETVEQVTPEIPDEFQDVETVEVPDAVGTLEGIIPDDAVAVAIDEGASELASTVVEAVTPIAPSVDSNPVAAVADLNPIAPITETSPLTPDIAAPLTGAGGGLAAVSPVTSTVSAVTSATPSTTVTSVAPNFGDTAPITAVTPEAEQLASVTTTPDPLGAESETSSTAPSAPAREPSAQDRRLGELIGRIRATPSDERCLIALPRRDGEEGIGLSMIAASESAMEAYAQELLTAEDADVRQTRTLVDQRQCAALSYISVSSDYPATRMGISADLTEIASGDNFTGVLRGAAGRYLTLLVVDDNGVVQDLQRFMSFSANLARFDVPVNRAGPARDTKQILLAIATTQPPNELRDRIGRLAEDVFGGLPSGLAADADLGVLTFDVR